MTEKSTELTTQFLGDNKESRFQISQENLLRIVSMDARPSADDVGGSKSSQMIMNEFGGPEGVARLLHTSVESGIKFNDQERTDRISTFGENAFPPPRIKTLCELIMENFEDQINRILLGAAIVSCVIGLIQHPFPEGMLEGTSIMIALCIIIIVGSGNNYASERRLAKLVALADKQEVSVYRKGKNDETETISYEELVVGDLVQIAKGMKVPADCMLVSGQNVQCGEDNLTGEPDDIDKHPLTQENFQHKSCVMFAKATVSNGVGTALVLAVGENTASGSITKKTQEEGAEPDTTLLQQKLNSIADQIGKVGYGCAILTFVAIFVRLILEMCGVIHCGCKNLATCEAPIIIDNKIQGCDELSFASADNRLYTELLNTIIIAITVIVVAIPEGLPLAVTISLSFSSAKMQKENNLVRKLASAETMGAVTHICSDKTGTLTQNVMTTMACMTHSKSYRMQSEDQPNTTQLAKDVQEGTGEAWNILKECAIWNGDARIEVPAQEEGYTGLATAKFEYQGNVTEVGILKFFAGVMGIEQVRETKLSLKKDKILCVIPFDSKTKRCSIVVQQDNGNVRVYTKGAPDVLFNMVTRAAVPGGVEPWDATVSNVEGFQSLAEIVQNAERSEPTHEDVFNATVKDYAMQAYRCILICYKDMTLDEFQALKSANNDFEEESDRYCLEQDLIAVGIFGIQDPLRDTIVNSVIQVKKAGIKVIMCTGDNIDTATAISKNAGIVTQADIDAHKEWTTMTGEKFRETVGVLKYVTDPKDPEKQVAVVGNQGMFNKVIKHLRVLARSSPDDKYLLVTGLQACEYETEETDLESQITNSSGKNYCSVAVTGDGTNDAPALSKADVGFAMGITGTDVAKGACDIILLDDNFASIITALKYGRNIYDNVRKFLQFQLTVNVVAMFIVFFGSVMLNDSPLTAVQMLWVNLIMDTLAALALATEPPDVNILERMPQPSSKAIVTEIMWRNVYGHAIYQMVALIVILFAAQGTLVEKYDVKCLITREGGQACPEGGLNPFYAGTHYFQLETKEYWTVTVKDKTDPKYFEPTAWAQFQCNNLLETYPASFTAETPCTAENFVAKLRTLNTEDKDTLLTVTDAEGDYRAFSPQKAVDGSGTQKLLHMTYVFQAFVFMQVFNQINARILTESFNIFDGICKNWLFVAVSVFTFVIQMVLVEVGGKVVKTYPLEMYQNGICLIIGSGELIWGVLIKFVPTKYFQCFNFEETPMTEEEAEKSVLASFKKGSVRKPKSKAAQSIETNVGNNLLKRVSEQKANIKKEQW